MRNSAEPTTCGHCGALIADGAVGLHMEWHKANNLHGIGCLVVKFPNPVGCTCGVGVNVNLQIAKLMK